MNIGSLYRVKEWYWLLFPSKESVSAARRRAPLHRSAAAYCGGLDAAYYSKKYNENVTYFSPDLYVVLLEEDGNLKKALTSDGLIGWTWFTDHFNDCFEEVKQQ